MSPILSALKAGHWQVLPTSILCLPTELCVAPSAGHCSALHCSGCCTEKALLQRIQDLLQHHPGEIQVGVETRLPLPPLGLRLS